MSTALTVIGGYLLLNAAAVALAWIFRRREQPSVAQRSNTPVREEAFPCAR